MLTPEDTLFIGMLCGLVIGYPFGFFMASAIYRRR